MASDSFTWMLANNFSSGFHQGFRSFHWKFNFNLQCYKTSDQFILLACGYRDMDALQTWQVWRALKKLELLLATP